MTDPRDRFAADFAVPPDTMAKFDRYAALLGETQARFNLVGPATLPEVWTRHFADSAQLIRLARPGVWVDLGSGAGFPGMVAALLGAFPVNLIEATAKKAGFLRMVADELALAGVTVHNARVESLTAFPAATISARACAPLAKLFDWGLRFATPGTQWLLPKGATVTAEIADARRAFRFDAELVPSMTHAEGRIIRAFHVERR